MADDVVKQTWDRYFYIRDTGHSRAVEKMVLCDDYFLGHQWPQADVDRLNAQKRPALTINKTLSRLAAVFGEQIRTRAEVGFKPSTKPSSGSSELMTQVWMAIANANQLAWKRGEVFCDGAIGSRGFFDVRLSFDTNVYGDVFIDKDDAKSVMIDSDANEFDPDSWADVLRTRWLSLPEAQTLYGNDIADRMKSATPGEWPHEMDMVVRYRDRFRDHSPIIVPWGYSSEDDAVSDIRVVERQVKESVDLEHFADPMTGDLRVVPYSWDRNRIAEYVRRRHVTVIRRKGTRIRWIQVCGNEAVKNEWSPYQHFTTIPYFPFFRGGRTTGLVEHLIGPQELLNKSLSQELHIINTSANSGWKVKQNSIKNMSLGELENRGAETGLIIELDDIGNAEKIQPNNIPQGIDRIAMKAEGFFDDVSGVPDSMVGTDRADVPAKARRASANRGALNLTKPLDNLERTDFFLARAVCAIVQEFYTEERVFRVVTDPFAEEAETLRVNYQNDAGELVNDLTAERYDIRVTSMPDQATFEETQFDEAVMMRKELGMPIPDEVIISNSRLANKRELIAQMAKKPPPPEQQAELDKMAAEIKKIYAEINRINADAMRKRTSAIGEVAKIGNESKEEQQPPPPQPGAKPGAAPGGAGAAPAQEEEPAPEPDYDTAAQQILSQRGVTQNATA
jgi:hypothetical protein